MTEIERYEPGRADMRVAATDSWTSALPDVINLADGIASTEFVPSGLRGSTAKVTAAILTGRELGLPPMTSLASIHVISGKPGISAELMRALILGAGHELVMDEMTEVRCTLRGRRAGSEEWSRATYTMAEAQRSGDARKNPQYQTRPAEMLLARATTRLARLAFADVIHGLSSVEELDSLEPVEAPPVVPAAPARVQRQMRPAARPAPLSPPVETATVADDAQPVETEAVEGHKEPMAPDDEAPPEAVPKPDGPQPLLSGSQRAKILMHFVRLGITDRDERLHWTAVMADRSLDSTNDLTRVEGSQIIARLERFADLAALERALGLAGDLDE